MTPWLRALTALAEDLGSIPSTRMVAHAPVRGQQFIMRLTHFTHKSK